MNYWLSTYGEDEHDSPNFTMNMENEGKTDEDYAEETSDVKAEFSSIEEVREYEERQNFILMKNKFLESVSKKIEKKKSENSETASYYIKKYESVLSFPINDSYDLDYVKFVFNNGKWRTDEEIKEAKQELIYTKEQIIRESDEFQNNYHPIAFALTIFFLFPLIPMFLLNECNLGGYLVCLGYGFIPIAIVSYLAFLIYECCYSWSHNVSPDKRIMKLGLAALVSGVVAYTISSKAYRAKLDKEKYKHI